MNVLQTVPTNELHQLAADTEKLEIKCKKKQIKSK